MAATLFMMKEKVLTTGNGDNPAVGVQEMESEDILNEVSQVLLNEFDLARSLGFSKAAHLFLAHDHISNGTGSVSSGGQVILKILSKEAASEASNVELFYLEARAAARLSHSNIVNTSEARSVGGLHLCTIERQSEVEALRGRLDRNAWLDAGEAVGVIHNVASALEYAHRNGIIHLNIAPENVLLDHKGTASVTEFGIEADCDLGWVHRRRSRHLPARYQSPEQAAGNPLDCRSDIYSAGVLLFEMLTDRTPFDGENPETIRHKQMARMAPSVQLFRSDVSDHLSQIVKRLLEKNPGDRFQTAGELLSALSKLRDSAAAGEIARVQARELPIRSVPDKAPSSSEASSSPADDRRAKPVRFEFEGDREPVPDDIDLVELVSSGLDETGIPDQRDDLLDLMCDEASSVGRASSESSANAVQCSGSNNRALPENGAGDSLERVLGAPPRRDRFEAPVIEVVAPDFRHLQLSESGIQNNFESPESAPGQTIGRFQKIALATGSSARPRAGYLTLLAAALLCLLAFAGSGGLAKIFKRSPSTVGAGDRSGGLAPDKMSGSTPAASLSPSSQESSQIGEESFTEARVAPRSERRRGQKLRRYDGRFRWRSTERRTRPVRSRRR